MGWREAAARKSWAEDFDTGRTMVYGKAHVIGSAFIAERGRHGSVNCIGRTRKRQPKLGQSPEPFMAAVRHRVEIGDRKVTYAILAIRRGSHCRSISGPH